VTGLDETVVIFEDQFDLYTTIDTDCSPLIMSIASEENIDLENIAFDNAGG
jgi:pyruvate/2-oxoacid:ferredoxin oxidoreductase alpha subunit